MRAGGVMIFVIAFFVAMLVTFALPSLPPGRELVGFLGISITDSTSTGIPTTTLVVGFFNGIVYGVTALLIYSLARWVPGMLSRNRDR